MDEHPHNSYELDYQNSKLKAKMKVSKNKSARTAIEYMVGIPSKANYKYLYHKAVNCPDKDQGTCAICKSMLYFSYFHIKHCKTQGCTVPSCEIMKAWIKQGVELGEQNSERENMLNLYAEASGITYSAVQQSSVEEGGVEDLATMNVSGSAASSDIPEQNERQQFVDLDALDIASLIVLPQFKPRPRRKSCDGAVTTVEPARGVDGPQQNDTLVRGIATMNLEDSAASVYAAEAAPNVQQSNCFQAIDGEGGADEGGMEESFQEEQDPLEWRSPTECNVNRYQMWLQSVPTFPIETIYTINAEQDL